MKGDAYGTVSGVDHAGWLDLSGQICNLMIQLLIFKKFLLNPVKKVIAERKAKADSQTPMLQSCARRLRP